MWTGQIKVWLVRARAHAHLSVLTKKLRVLQGLLLYCFRVRVQGKFTRSFATCILALSRARCLLNGLPNICAADRALVASD